MTNPETDFGEALRRAFSGAAEAAPDGDALERIRARASVRTPKRRIDAFLAAIIPWRAYRLLHYRTMAKDTLGAWSSAVWSADAVQRVRQWTAGSARRVRGWMASSVRRVREWSGGWPTAARDWLVTSVRTRLLVPARDRLVAPAREWLAAPARAWFGPEPTSAAAGQPKHADSGPPPNRIGWMRPVLAATAMAFVAVLAVTVGPVRQAIVQLGSSVMSNGQSHNGSSTGMLNGTGNHVSPDSVTTVSPVAGTRSSSTSPSASRSASSCAAALARSSSATTCPTPTASAAVSSSATASAAASSSPTSGASTSPPASSSPSVSASPSASPSVEASAGADAQATSTP